MQPSFQLCELFLGGPAVPSRLARPSRGCCSANPILSLAGLGHVVPNECRTSVALGWWDGGELVRENFGATIRLRCRLVPCCLGSRFSRRAIRSSPGGEVLSYLSLFELVRKSGERVIIDGPCLSACTLVLSVVPGNRICVTRKAVLGIFGLRGNAGHRGNLSGAGSRLDRSAWGTLSTSSFAPRPGAHGNVPILQLMLVGLPAGLPLITFHYQRLNSGPLLDRLSRAAVVCAGP